MTAVGVAAAVDTAGVEFVDIRGFPSCISTARVYREVPLLLQL